ncbi:MAG: hypothetical protein KF726_11065 [Anaerolineae bacterium]|nr:hypothetical protein [Anaerolineae bacterium]
MISGAGRPATTATPTYEPPIRTEVESLALIAPKDKLRFGPILAGLATTITILVTMALLGAALGLSTLDANSSNNNPGTFAAVWGGFSALVAFFLGGHAAGWATAIPGKRIGAANGAMVFVIAVPILLWLAVSGVGSVLGTFRDIAVAGITAAPAAAQVAQDAIQTNPGLQPTVQAGATSAPAMAATAVATAVEGAQNIPPQQVEQAAQVAGNAAWGALLSLGLGVVAATIGGWIGARRSDVDIVRTETVVNR